MSKLYPEDQKKVDEFVSSNVNAVSRAAFKPLTLLLVIVAVLGFITGVSYIVALDHGLI